MPIRRGNDERFNAALDQRVPSSWHVECKERIDDLPGTLSSEEGSSCGPLEAAPTMPLGAIRQQPEENM